MLKGLNLALLFFGLLVCVSAEDHDAQGEHGHAGHGADTVDPYHEVLNFLNISQEHAFTVDKLDDLIEHLNERLQCEDHDHDEHDEHDHDHDHDHEHEHNGDVDGDHDDGADNACNKTICVDATTLLHATNTSHNGTVSEAVFGPIATTLLHVAMNSSDNCRDQSNLTSDDVISFRGKLLDTLSGGQPITGLKLGSIQEALEMIHLAEVHEHSEGEHAHAPGDEDTANEEHADHEHEHGGEEEHAHAEVIEDKCLGADTLFDQLGLDVDEPAGHDHLNELSALVVYHLLSGANVSRTCRKLPRGEMFQKHVYKLLGAQNDTLTHSSFDELRDRLGLSTAAHVEEDHSGHDHRKRRSVDMSTILEPGTWTNRCYTGEELFGIYHVPEGGLPLNQFSSICPALIQQQLSQACVQHAASEEVGNGLPSDLERYGWGTLATFIVCLGSVLGIVIIPFASQSVYQVILAIFMGMAVGTLTADAFLHLIPMALGVHAHEDHDHAHGGEITIEPFVVYGLVVCGGLYVFYLFEKVVHLIRGQRTYSHGEDCIERSHDTEVSTVSASFDDISYPQKGFSGGKKNGFVTISKPIETKSTTSDIPPVVIMILIGDGIHNFADGLAIGAAFTSSITLGVSTSIAVFCHEVPHELGDFAVLLNSGISKCKALLFNFMSSLTAMTGLYIGLAVSKNDETRNWIVAVTAGMFLYVALVDLMPQLIEVKKKPKQTFFFHNVGILFGATIMFLLAIFEEHIKI